jgi:hypothetical protein
MIEKGNNTIDRSKKKAPDSQLPADVAQNQLPPSILALIDENTLYLSGASEFFRKKAETAALLQDFVEAFPNSSYRLKNGFDRFFLANLPMFAQTHRLSAPDALADALFTLGRQWARIDYGKLPIATVPTDEYLRSQWKGADEWEAFMRTDTCIGESWWRNLDERGAVGLWSGEVGPGDFQLRVDFGPEITQPPKVSILIKGEPAALLMNWWVALRPNSSPDTYPDNEELRAKVESMMDSLVKQLKTDLRLVRPQKGRPRRDLGERAAYLLDHERKTLAFVAKQLYCMPKDASPSARRQYFDRVKKAANNYYKLLGSDYTTVTKRMVRTRIIRVPPNPNAVKSE